MTKPDGLVIDHPHPRLPVLFEQWPIAGSVAVTVAWAVADSHRASLSLSARLALIVNRSSFSASCPETLPAKLMWQ